MKILHFHTKLVAGGIEAMVCSLANEMVKTEDVTVCTIFKPSESDIYFRKLHVDVKKESIGKLSFGFSFKEPFLVYKYIKNGSFDVVNIHGCFQYYILAVLFLHRRVRFFYTIHSDARMENQKWDKRFFWFKSFCFKNQWIIPITISKTSQRSFKDLYSCNSYLIPNGIPKPVINFEKRNKSELSKLKRKSNTKLFVHPGRISEAKNQIVLCRAFTNLVNKGYPIKLLIAGASEDKSIYNHLEKYFGESIIYLGERDDVLELLSQADGLCLPSIWEGLPITLLEALSVGCIPICSPVGGMKDVIKDGYNGILSKSPSEEDYTCAVKRFLEFDDTKCRELRENGQKTFDNFRIENTANKYIELYKKEKYEVK